MNRWNIDDDLEKEIKERDKRCVYCNNEMVSTIPPDKSRQYLATWEHIINDASIITIDNIARCCSPCNSSKGKKLLADWLKSDYCKKKNINKDTVAPVIKKVLNTK